jgi:branched-chain amino acid transport system ATP-binding protein
VSEAALVVEGLEVSYNSVRALYGVSFQLEAGKTLAVLGPNGAGKSSLARTVCGLVPATGGRILVSGTDVTSWSPHRIHSLGVTYVPEGRGVFPTLSVADNLRVAVWHLKGRLARSAAIERSYEIFPILANRRGQLAGTLSGGEQQMLALARAFSSDPRVIVADELSLGLAPLIVDQVFESLHAAQSLGASLIVIEQFVERALAMSDDCLILRHGKIAWEGNAADATRAVRDEYLGSKDLD